jgi:hypothetical protein
MADINIDQVLAQFFVRQERGNQDLMNVLDALLQQNQMLRSALEKAQKDLASHPKSTEKLKK